MSIGDAGEPCLYCSGETVAFMDSESPNHYCRNINCPMAYQPQEWYAEIELVDGRTAVVAKIDLKKLKEEA